MKAPDTAFTLFAWRITAVHVITYSVIGWIAMTVLSYRELFASGHLYHLMRSLDSPWIAAGPGLQVIRGLIFAVVLWPFSNIILFDKRGWIKLWGLFLGLAIFSTAGPTIGSVEGIIYTKIPSMVQLMLIPEIVIQTLLLSLLLIFWYRKPAKILNIISSVLVFAILLMSLLGYIYLK
jgi:hypothetical protein